MWIINSASLTKKKKLKKKTLILESPSVPGMWFKECLSVSLQRELITKRGQYCKCHVFYSMLVHGPASGYNGETGGVRGNTPQYFSPLHLWQHTTVNTHIPPACKKTHAGKLEGLWRLFLLTALFVLLVQRIRDRVAMFQIFESCLAVYRPLASKTVS